MNRLAPGIVLLRMGTGNEAVGKLEWRLPTTSIIGHSIDRLAALSDGIFAVTMTLLVLDLRAPSKEVVGSEQALWRALGAMSPQFITYLMSFLTLGVFWNGQQAQLSQFARGDRLLTWTHIAFLFGVSIMPFSTRLLTEFISYRAALLCYWGNIVLLGAAGYLSWFHASRAGLVRDGTPDEVGKAIKRRIVTAQTLYAVGAALCVVDNYVSIAFIVLVQLSIAIAGRIRFPKRS